MSGCNGRLLRLFSEVVTKEMVGRAMRITERCGALSVVQPVTKHVAECRQDMVVAFQPEQEISGIEQPALTMVSVPVILGDTHFEQLAESYDIGILSPADAVDVGGHLGVDPEFDLAAECLQRQDVRDVPEIFVVPEQDFTMARDTEMVKLFHSPLFLSAARYAIVP